MGGGGSNKKNHSVYLVLCTKRKNSDSHSDHRLWRAFNYGQEPNMYTLFCREISFVAMRIRIWIQANIVRSQRLPQVSRIVFIDVFVQIIRNCQKHSKLVKIGKFWQYSKTNLVITVKVSNLQIVKNCLNCKNPCKLSKLSTTVINCQNCQRL